ncbi:hypothetical protein K443DRAFT_390501 [Laccaria amethystina LaAM-08-1]|uniref:Uncharacterized protein n=1 Tax=Laccaria amethystina LaAM-08-1 TaxID=1095629 RepID=A0A0C9XX76_9AGAR|nr:hypothetical protein K443DRAFT_390501 [Laccaria amethystina LaAM-08-1]
MKPTRWADTNFLVHTKVSGVQWRRAESLLIYIENLIPFFCFLSIPQSNANHFVFSCSPLFRSFVVHNNSWPVHRYLYVLQIFMFAPACENSRRPCGCQRSTIVAYLCRETSLLCFGWGGS